MPNPWEGIALNDYENHMKLGSVLQLQTLNEMMKRQLCAYHVSNVTILGIAGGNGLEHIREGEFEKIYGIDVNRAYLEAAAERYPKLHGVLQCLHIDLICESDKLPKTDIVIADLLVEYIGYECFVKCVLRAEPKYVSVVIQINTEDGWVSDSPYLHAFDCLESVHHQMSEDTLKEKMLGIGYRAVLSEERALPNGKKLTRIDFKRQEARRCSIDFEPFGFKSGINTVF